MRRDTASGVWAEAWQRLRADRVGCAALAVVAAFLVMVGLAGAGVLAADWQREVGVPAAPPAWLPSQAPVAAGEGVATAPAGAVRRLDITEVDPLAPRYAEWSDRARLLARDEPPRAETLPMGGDRLGRDVLAKAIKGAQVSISVGLAAAVLATLLGTLLGAVAGFAGGRLGDALEWLYNVFTAIPGILLILAFAALFGRGMGTVALILGLTGWTGVYRQVRAEFIKHVARDYVRAAQAIGVGPVSRMFGHVLPNVSHVILVQLSILMVGFIKAEVILSYLGLGVSVDDVSWGTMLAESQGELLLGQWWQLATTTAFMAVFVTAFSLFTDALRDALDPRLKGVS